MTRIVMCLPVLAVLPAGGPMTLLVAALTAVGLGCAAGLGWAMALRLGTFLLPLGIILALIHGFLIQRGAAVTFGPFDVFPDGLTYAGMLLLRLAALLAAALLVVLTTTPSQLANGLEDKGLPAAASYLFTAPLMLATNVADEAAAARDALRLRGLALAGGPVQRLRVVWKIVLAVVRAQLTEITPRAMAMDARGFRAMPRRTLMHPPEDSRGQHRFRIGCIGLAGGLFLATLVV